MKCDEKSELHEGSAPSVKRQATAEKRLVSRPDQKVLREWEITLPDGLVAALTLGNV
jgi:hypothetical protein